MMPVLVLAAALAQAPVGDDAGAENRPMQGETTPAWRMSVDRGLRALAGLQNDDGSFGRGRFGDLLRGIGDLLGCEA